MLHEQLPIALFRNIIVTRIESCLSQCFHGFRIIGLQLQCTFKTRLGIEKVLALHCQKSLQHLIIGIAWVCKEIKNAHEISHLVVLQQVALQRLDLFVEEWILQQLIGKEEFLWMMLIVKG